MTWLLASKHCYRLACTVSSVLYIHRLHETLLLLAEIATRVSRLSLADCQLLDAERQGVSLRTRLLSILLYTRSHVRFRVFRSNNLL